MTRIVQHLASRLAWRRVLRLTKLAGDAEVDACALQIFEALSHVEDSGVDLAVETWVSELCGQAIRCAAGNELRGVQVAIDNLPSSRKLMVKLFIGGMKHTEIADQFGLHKQDALRELRAALVTLRDA